MKILYLFLLTFIILLLGYSLVLGQPNLPSPPSQAPIDGGLGLLAAAGGAYAFKKLKDKKQSSE